MEIKPFTKLAQEQNIIKQDITPFKYNGPPRLWLQIAENALTLEDQSIRGEICVTPFGTGQKVFNVEEVTANIGYIWRGKPSYYFPFDVESHRSSSGKREINLDVDLDNLDNLDLDSWHEAWLDPSRSELVGLYYLTSSNTLEEFLKEDRYGVDFFNSLPTKRGFLGLPNGKVLEITGEQLKDMEEIEHEQYEKKLTAILNIKPFTKLAQEKPSITIYTKENGKQEITKDKSFTKLAYKKWTEEDVKELKDLYIKGRKEEVPHKKLWRNIALRLRRTPSEVQRRIVRLYKEDPSLKEYKQENWSREKIIEQLKDLYLANKPMNKSALPPRLKFILLKVTPPSAPSHREWFQSQDEAMAEAILACGHCRNDDGTMDLDSPINTLEEAKEYIRNGIKKRHEWTLDEVKEVLAALNASDYPITLPFLTNHHSIYRSALQSNRKLESFKDVVKKFVEAGQIKSYADLVCSIAPDYKDYYNEDMSRLRLSTEEIRVKKFLDRYKIAYFIPRLTNKIPTNSDKFANFVPDFVLTDDSNNPRAIIEVFGSIGDRENSGVNDLYNEKTIAKIEFYKTIPDIQFIEIHNNQGRCDLDDEALFSRLASYVNLTKMNKGPTSLEDIITSSLDESIACIAKYGSSILIQEKGYHFISAAQDFRFDSLYELSDLAVTSSPELKKVLDMIAENRFKGKYPIDQKHPAEHSYDYMPRSTDIFNDSNRQVSTRMNEDGTGPVG